MTISRRLFILATVPLLSLVTLCAIGYVEFSNIEPKTQKIARIDIPSMTLINRITRNLGETRVLIREFLLSPPSARPMVAAKLAEKQPLLAADFATYEKEYISDEADRLLMSSTRELVDRWFAVSDQIQSRENSGQGEDTLRYKDDHLLPLGPQLDSRLSAWSAYNAKSAFDQSTAILVGAGRTVQIFTAASVVVLFVTGIVGLWTYRRVVDPLQELQRTVARIAEGDYQIDVPHLSAS
ncbi:MCP four helix bundle domain-containing protein, partial [Singulisphaera rosea]